MAKVEFPSDVVETIFSYIPIIWGHHPSDEGWEVEGDFESEIHVDEGYEGVREMLGIHRVTKVIVSKRNLDYFPKFMRHFRGKIEDFHIMSSRAMRAVYGILSSRGYAHLRTLYRITFDNGNWIYAKKFLKHTKNLKDLSLVDMSDKNLPTPRQLKKYAPDAKILCIHFTNVQFPQNESG